MRLMFCLCSVAVGCWPQALPANFACAGSAFNAASHPPVAGFFSYATLISDRGQLYSFSTHDVFLSQTKPYTVQSSVRTGLATVFRTLGPIVILGVGDAGVAA